MDIRTKIQSLLATPNYHPLRRAEIAGKLRLKPNERVEFRRVLDEMARKGEVARVRQDRFVLPQEADLVSGRIAINEKGFAFVIPETPTEAGDIYIAQEDTGVAWQGDKGMGRVNRERRNKASDKTSGRVIRILERATDTVVGTLQK